MKAAVLEKLDKIVIKDVKEPKCGDNEVILRVKACAVCGSDIRIFHYGNDRVKLPTVMGHEIAGDIIEIGKNVTKVSVGDRIALGADVPCGTCYWCTNGLCNNCKINYAIGYQFEGGFQEKMVLNEITLNYGPVTIIPDNVSYKEATLAEPLACIINGFELGEFNLGKSICIIGLGPIGNMMLELSRVYGASKIFAAEISEERIELAQKMFPNARYINVEKENLVKTVISETNEKGVDFAITPSGSVKAHEDAIEIVRNRGVVNLFGGLKNQPKLCIDSNLIHYKECKVLGSHGSTPRHHKIAIDLISNGYIDAKKYITEVFSLTDIIKAFEYTESKKGLKAVIIPGK